MPIAPTDLLIAVVFGALPTLIWLGFWLSEDREHPEPRLMIAFTFILGALAVMIAKPLQEALVEFFNQPGEFAFFLGLAGIEELVKFGLVLGFVSLTPFVDEPLDYSIYLITGALGFAAFENTLYLLDPIRSVFSNQTFAISALRYLGSTLVHVVMAGIIGYGLGIVWHQHWWRKISVFLGTLILATLLHASFNFFIISGTQTTIIVVLVTVWIMAMAIMYGQERLKLKH